MNQILTQTRTMAADPVYAEPLVEEECNEADYIGALPTIELTSTTEFRVEPCEAVHLGQDESLPFGTTMALATELHVPEKSSIDMGLEGDSIKFASGNASAQPVFTSFTFYKKSANMSIGLHFHGDTTVIASIDNESLASEAHLKIGDKLMSVNNKNCSEMNKPLRKYLEKLVGRVTLVVYNKRGSSNIVESRVAKSNSSEVMGLGLRRGGPRNALFVSSVYPTHAFGGSLLNIGDQVLAINHVTCDDLRAEEAAQIIRQTPKYVSILVKTGCETGSVVAEESSRPIRLPGGGIRFAKLFRKMHRIGGTTTHQQ